MSNDFRIEVKMTKFTISIFKYVAKCIRKRDRDLIDRLLKCISTFDKISIHDVYIYPQHMLKSSWAVVSVLACNICSIKFNTHIWVFLVLSVNEKTN